MEPKEIRILRGYADRYYHVWITTRDPKMRVAAQHQFMFTQARLDLALAELSKDVRRIKVCTLHLLMIEASPSHYIDTPFSTKGV